MLLPIRPTSREQTVLIYSDCYALHDLLSLKKYQVCYIQNVVFMELPGGIIGMTNSDFDGIVLQSSIPVNVVTRYI